MQFFTLTNIVFKIQSPKLPAAVFSFEKTIAESQFLTKKSASPRLFSHTLRRWFLAAFMPKLCRVIHIFSSVTSIAKRPIHSQPLTSDRRQIRNWAQSDQHNFRPDIA